MCPARELDTVPHPSQTLLAFMPETLPQQVPVTVSPNTYAKLLR
jgi:hypothetical protein